MHSLTRGLPCSARLFMKHSYSEEGGEKINGEILELVKQSQISLVFSFQSACMDYLYGLPEPSINSLSLQLQLGDKGV